MRCRSRIAGAPECVMQYALHPRGKAVLRMDVQFRNNVHIVGAGSPTLVLAHGFGCDQNIWRLLVPQLQDRFRLVLFDYVGSGHSDLRQYDPVKYASLEGYADDLVEVAQAIDGGPLVLVGHSVSAMIGLLADRKVPGLFAGHVMIGPSPCYINQDGYVGGFDRAEIDELLDTLEANYLGWADQMAPVIMGAPGQPELSTELSNSFCRTAPDIASRFARATFFGNNLADLPALASPVLVLQSTEDLIAPVPVGEHVHRMLPDARLQLIENVGHCPHLSEPAACAERIEAFVDSLALGPLAA